MQQGKNWTQRVPKGSMDMRLQVLHQMQEDDLRERLKDKYCNLFMPGHHKLRESGRERDLHALRNACLPQKLSSGLPLVAAELEGGM